MSVVAEAARMIDLDRTEVRSMLELDRATIYRPVEWECLHPGLNLGFSGLSPGHYCTGVPESGHVLYARRDDGVWDQKTKPATCPFGVPGDRFCGREDWRVTGRHTDASSAEVILANRAHFTFWRQADVSFNDDFLGKIRAACDMPPWLVRIHREITAVSVERLDRLYGGPWFWAIESRKVEGGDACQP